MEPESGQGGLVLLISFKASGILSMWLGYGHVKRASCNITYEMKREIKNHSVITNLLDSIELDLDKDYEKDSYVFVCRQKRLIVSLEELLHADYKVEKPPVKYSDSHSSYVLAPYAQHNAQCRRRYGILAESEIRGEFQRDRERIVNSKAFRRLVDKAQIFSAEKGDHYRTRMTHTLEVNQIAKAIASALNLNLDLTEAIALAHDLGHTPFGHQGERTLYNILSGDDLAGILCIQYEGEIKAPLAELLGGFKHNYQSVRVLTKLEEKYIEYAGLDISYQVLEGVLKHTKLKNAELEEFADSETIDNLYKEQKFSSTLEGQVVFIADEIAQRGHDVDDALTSGLITLDEIIDYLELDKFSELRKLLESEKESLEKHARNYVDEKELYIGRSVSCIVGYFINDVIKNSKTKIDLCIKMNPEYVKTGVFKEKLIDFSEKEGSASCKFLEKIINKRVIADTEVSRFDYNGSVIISTLFEAYYKNPKLLHKGTLRKLYIDILQNPNPLVSAAAIDLREGDIDTINNEIKDLSESIIILKEGGMSEEDEIRFEKRKIFVRNIVDYIAGMTDSYAIAEYNRIRK